MREQFGKMRPSTMQQILDASRNTKSSLWVALTPDIVSLFRDGDTLRAVEHSWVVEWLKEIGREDLEPEDVQTVQIPRDWAAKMLGGHQQNASRALRELTTLGILTPIHKGIKDHATLYCVNPLPSPNSQNLTWYAEDCEGIYPHT